MTKYDLIIVGSGPTGIFTAMEYIKKNKNKKVLILEKGRGIKERKCPKRIDNICRNCNPCNITTGFSGAGAYSDGKLTLSPDVGGNLAEIIGYDKLNKLIEYVDSIYLSYGADTVTYGNKDHVDVIEELRYRAIKSNLKLIDSEVRHLGTEKSYELYSKIQDFILDQGIEIKFNNMVKDLIVEDNKIKGVIADKKYYSEKVVLSVGREGAEWLTNICEKENIEKSVGIVDIGVRVEIRNEIMKQVNDSLYESKLVYYTKTFDDKVRTFCHNPSGHVSTEIYDGLAVVNGHSYKGEEYKSDNTNFAVLVSNYFTEPFNNPIEYGKYIAKLGNLLSGNKIIVQRFGDFKKGRRTTNNRLQRNNITPTLTDAIPGDLSLVIPYRIMLDIKEMIEALDNIFPGIASDETLLYGLEVKFYSNKIKINENFESNIEGLYVGGDGAGITRGLMQASVNGVILGKLL